MQFNRNENLKIVGFFGQSGAGKTTIIRNVDKKVNGQIVLQNTGIIRYLFKKNNNYKNPVDIISKKDSIPPEKINELVYEKYIRSQMQLLNDWSTEMFLSTLEHYLTPSILLLDRSPVDFYVITLGGLKVLTKEFGVELNSDNQHLLEINRKIAEDNTNNFFDAVFITKPWNNGNINTLCDGVRDQYLAEEYTGENWYSHYKDVNLIHEVKSFVIGEDVTDLQKRAKFVSAKLTEV